MQNLSLSRGSIPNGESMRHGKLWISVYHQLIANVFCKLLSSTVLRGDMLILQKTLCHKQRAINKHLTKKGQICILSSQNS